MFFIHKSLVKLFDTKEFSNVFENFGDVAIHNVIYTEVYIAIIFR